MNEEIDKWNEKIILILITVLVSVSVLYVAVLVLQVQQTQIDGVFTKGCNNTPIEKGCYTTDDNNFLIYCKPSFNATSNISEPYCERVVVV